MDGVVIILSVFASTCFAVPLTSTPELPLEFPQINQSYPFVDNSTIRKNLVNLSKIDTEVSDLLSSNETNEQIIDEDGARKNAFELIENGENTEDDKYKTETSLTDTFSGKTTKKYKLIEGYEGGVALIDGTVAAVLVGVFLVGCICGYIALILWRRNLENKYGSRQMLVDDMFDPDDIKHFSI